MNNSLYDFASHGDFHVYSFKDIFYLFDIEQVSAYEIPEKLYWMLAKNRDPEFVRNTLQHLPQNQMKKPILPDETTALGNISLNVAQVCNLSCVYCYGVDGEYGLKGMMDEATAYKSVDFLISEAGNRKDISITFFGGEPLLNFKLVQKVVDYSRIQALKHKKKIQFSITTNGTKFNDEINAYLNDNEFRVTISFDGDEEIQNKNRPFRGGKGSYSDIKPKIQNFLKSRNGNATARATVTNHSINLENLKNRLKEMGFKKAGATVATLSEFAVENRDVSQIDVNQFEDIIQSYESEAANISQIASERSDKTKISDSRIWLYIRQLHEKTKNYHSCGVGRSMVGIAINGDVYPCHRFVGVDKFKLGNVADFESNNRKSYSQSFTQKHPVCSNCWAKYFCGGAGCIQDNEVTMGDVNSINTRHCTQLKMQLKHAIHLYNNLPEPDRDFLL